MRWVRRLLYWASIRRQDAELREELAFHRDQLAETLHERGLSAPQARDAARRLLTSLHTHAPARDREVEAQKARERSRARFAT